jgi:hypothetical protein
MILVYTCQEGISSFSLNPCQMRAIAQVGGLSWEITVFILEGISGSAYQRFLVILSCWSSQLKF